MRVANGLWSLEKGADMIEINLLDCLVQELQKVFKDYSLPAKDGTMKNVKTFAQYLPQPSSIEFNNEDSGNENEDEIIKPEGYGPADIEANFPCVIVKLEDTNIKEENTLDSVRINMRFLIGVYDDSPDCQGYRDALNVIEKIQQFLLTLPNRILNHRYQLKMPMKSYLFEEQAWPIYFAQIETCWETGRALMPYHPAIKNFDE